jgi:hypothetical protein
VRTVRGMELGEVLGSPHDAVEVLADELLVDEVLAEEADSATVGLVPDGAILRRMTIEDQLLEARLERNRHDAFAACCRRLSELGVSAPLLDVEHLFDGRGLYFYFLGQPPAEAEQLTAELANVYDANVQFRQFAETLTAGCGPDCGTAKAGGGGCSSCGTGCAVASACKAH